MDQKTVQYKLSFIIAMNIISFFAILFLMAFPFHIYNTNPGIGLVTLTFGICVAGEIFLIRWLIIVNTYELTITSDKVIKKTYFGEDILKLKEIDGYVIGEKYLKLVPIDKKRNSLSISEQVEDYDELLILIKKNIENLVVKESIREKVSILNDQNLGEDPDERINFVKHKAKTSSILVYIAYFFALWLMVFPEPYDLLSLINLILPIIGLIYVLTSKGLVTPFIIDKDKNSIAGVFISSMGINVLRVLMDYNIYAYDTIWYVAVIPTLVLLVILYRFFNLGEKVKDFNWKRDWGFLFQPVVMYIGISFWLLSVNCNFDDLSRREYQVKVLDKRFYEGDQIDEFYFKVKPWATRKVVNEISVPEYLYDEIEIGDTIDIYLYDGFLGIPWYEVTSD